MTTSELVPSVSIDALLLKRDAMIERLRTAHRSLQELEELGNALLGVTDFDVPKFSSLSLEDRRLNERFTSATTLPRFERDVDAKVWDLLLDKSGLWTFMDTEARKTWRKQIDDGEVPEVTRGNAPIAAPSGRASTAVMDAAASHGRNRSRARTSSAKAGDAGLAWRAAPTSGRPSGSAPVARI